ncbi:MAG: septum formation initiator family protein [Lachnospiraceae bacterium]|nr:septum formation initiator family protein [Lachnospiraceae bacterium]
MREITPNDYRYQTREQLLGYSSYVSGSNVLELPPVDDPRQVDKRKKNKKHKKSTGNSHKKNTKNRTTSKKRGLHVVTQAEANAYRRKMDPGEALYTKSEIHANNITVLMVVGVLFIIGFYCVQYIHLGAMEDEYKDKIAELNAQYITLKDENDLIEKNMSSLVNYDEIREVAMNELGMVYAQKDQVITYKSETMEAVRQLQNIPSN